MSKMKEEVMKSVTHRIEVLEGDLHDYKDQNEKLMNRVKTLENDLTKKSGALDKQRKEMRNFRLRYKILIKRSMVE